MPVFVQSSVLIKRDLLRKSTMKKNSLIVAYLENIRPILLQDFTFVYGFDIIIIVNAAYPGCNERPCWFIVMYSKSLSHMQPSFL